MQPAVKQAIEEVRANCLGVEVSVREDGQGGAYVVVEEVDPGAIYTQRSTWIGFHISFQYPYADTYPHYVRGDLSRGDGRALGDGTSLCVWEGRQAVQVSRRSNRLNPRTDTAVLKMNKVLQWLATRP